MKEADVIVIGAGVLGICTAYWLSTLFDGKILVLDKESTVGSVTTRRNTGVIHRPFYLDPIRKRTFAKSAQISFSMWKALAEKYSLPWSQVGTLELAVSEHQLNTLETYRNWAKSNGMRDSEFKILDSAGVHRLEPHVSASGGIFSATDISTDFQVLTQKLAEIIRNNNVKISLPSRVTGITDKKGEVEINTLSEGSSVVYRTPVIFNTTGSSSLDLAHRLGLGREFSVLYFRGEYLKVRDSSNIRVSRNIYTIPQFREFPFLDPHLILKHDGKMEIGPNAVPVADSNAYRGLYSTKYDLFKLFFGRPVLPKLNLALSRRFISLAMGEWKSSMGKRFMIARVRKFLPTISLNDVNGGGISGIRGSVIDKNGFVPEAVTLYGDSSIHLINYNSPGATGAPAYSLHVLENAIQKGYFDHLLRREISDPLWSLSSTTFD